MSTFQEQWQPFQQQPLYVDPHAFALGHYDHLARDKTPTESLINHTGLSPIPLTATPPLSRNTSRPPEPPRDQPDLMLWDNGSLSSSPTSVRTPDGDSPDFEMLDPDPLHYYHQSAVSMSTQESSDAVTAINSNMMFTPHGTFSDYGMSMQSLQYLFTDSYSCEHSSEPDNGISHAAALSFLQWTGSANK